MNSILLIPPALSDFPEGSRFFVTPRDSNPHKCDLIVCPPTDAQGSWEWRIEEEGRGEVWRRFEGPDYTNQLAHCQRYTEVDRAWVAEHVPVCHAGLEMEEGF